MFEGAVAYTFVAVDALPVFIVAAVFAILHTLANSIDSENQTAKGFLSAAVAGTCLGVLIGTFSIAPVLAMFMMITGVLYLAIFLLSLFTCLLRWDFPAMMNALKLFLGIFYLDNHRSLLAAAWQGISRLSWEFLQTTIGYVYAQVMNMIGKTNNVAYFGGATFSITSNNRKHRGVSIGNYISIIQQSAVLNFTTDSLVMHEYGHTFDSQKFGPLYLLVVGIPSLVSAASIKPVHGTHLNSHNLRWYEKSSDRHAAKYFAKHNHSRL